MTCFNEKNQHVGNLQRLRSFLIDAMGVWASVYWCPVCGAVVIDQEIDGRRMGNVMEMKFPVLAKENIDKLKEE